VEPRYRYKEPEPQQQASDAGTMLRATDDAGEAPKP
jgi:hypothetical protein